MSPETLVQIARINRTGTDPATPGWHRESSPLASYPYQPGEHILIIGAYSGTVAELVLKERVWAMHWLFEPQDWACRQLRERFARHSNVKVCQYGLGDREGVFQMGLYTSYDCTFVRGSIPFKDLPGVWYDAQLMEFADTMRVLNIQDIHYAHLNIEGYEYVLIPWMARQGWLSRCRLLGISWHDARFNCPVKGPYMWRGERTPGYDQMQALLPLTHELVLEIDNWQSWLRKEP